MRWGDLRGEDLLDPLRDVALPAAPAGGSPKLPPLTHPEVLLKRGTGDVGDRHATPLSLVAKPSVEVVRELHGGAPHGMPAYHSSIRLQLPVNSFHEDKVITMRQFRDRGEAWAAVTAHSQ